MIIEIGTSDFRTQALARGAEQGLYIEPVKEYFDRLPNHLRKEQVAVSNYEGEIELHYIPSKIIEENKLPNWLRGCNSVNKVHLTVEASGLSHFSVVDKVPVVRIKTLLDKYEVDSIELLKIDTEGHDCVILNDFLDTCDILPKTIQFESNILSDSNDVKGVVERLKKKGYICQQVKFDMVCRL